MKEKRKGTCLGLHSQGKSSSRVQSPTDLAPELVLLTTIPKFKPSWLSKILFHQNSIHTSFISKYLEQKFHETTYNLTL